MPVFFIVTFDKNSLRMDLYLLAIVVVSKTNKLFLFVKLAEEN